eukprot:TRINITY_DN24746_c0_g1_i1.p1 TRINITY_DN24746_c0_g1~~TRINITY_DN24746_c0_g1_i1.p1  ORF type:complete len:542 (+),score=129.69 TRINITY_DN24746_c0_g1_i1:56-1627(+)
MLNTTRRVVLLLIMMYALTVAKCKFSSSSAPEEPEVELTGYSICPNGDKRGIGYVPLGVRDILWNSETDEGPGKVKWATIEIPETMLTAGRSKKELYTSVLAKIQDYKSLLVGTRRIGIKGHVRSQQVNEVFQHAARCAGVGYIPRTKDMILSIQESICHGGNEAFWVYRGAIQAACAKGVAAYANEEPSAADIGQHREPELIIDPATLGLELQAEMEVPPLTRKRCDTTDEMYPGYLNASRWVPDRCDMTRYSNTRAALCLKQAPFMAIGDKRGKDIVENFLLRFYRSKITGDKDKGPRYISNIWKPSTATPFTTLTKGTSIEAPVDASPFLANEAKFLLYSVASMDVGPHFCGTDHYYHTMKEDIMRYKSLAREDAVIALYMLPFIHHKNPWVKACHPVEKLAVFRQMMLQLASCLRLPVFDVKAIQKAKPEDSDGVHMYGFGLIATSEILLNVLCDGVGLTYPNLPCTPEAEHAALAQWREDPIANRRSCHTATLPNCNQTFTFLPPLPTQPPSLQPLRQ